MTWTLTSYYESMMAPGLEEIYEKDARSLIECITNLKEGDDSFDECIDYVISNFCFSRFLDVNRHSVLRSIDGLCRKFLIHSQEKKAEVLESLCRKFVQSEVFKELNIVNVLKPEFIHEIGNLVLELQFEPQLLAQCSDVQYSLLGLLILLADNPTANNVSMPQIDEFGTTDADDGKNDFRCRSYLLEDEPHYDASLSSSSDLSDWSDCDDDKSVEEGDVVNVGEGSRFFPRGVLHCEEDERRSCEMTDAVLRNELMGRGWLCHHIQSPYWVGISLDSASSGGRSSSRNLTSNLRSQWEDHVQQSNVLRLTSSVPVELTERKILRETLWMLGGRGQLFVFECVFGIFLIREGVVVSHMTEKCLHQLLTPFTTCSSTILKLRSFADEFVDGTSSEGTDRHRLLCRTYQAYAFTLSSLLLDFDRVLCSLEGIVVEQRETFTLTMLLERLEPWIDDFDVLSRIHETVLECEGESAALCDRVCHLLQELFLAVVNYSSKGKDSVSFLLRLFLSTVRPYLEIIDTWVTFGCLRDEHGEFPIERNRDVSMSHEKFWESAVLVKCVCPSFVEPQILNLLLVTGKSMELLRCLGKLPEVAKCGSKSSSKSLYDAFVELVGCELHDPRQEDRDSEKDDRKSAETSGPIWKSILAKNFDDYVDTSDVISTPHDTVATERLSTGVSLGRSLRLLLSSCFSKEVSVRCRQTCRMLMAILNEEHSLHDDLLSIRRFWLMEAGDFLFHFYSQVFEKISRTDIWSEEMNLRIILDDVLLTFSPGDVSRGITVCLDESVLDASCVRRRRPLDCYDGIRLYYRNRWPLDLIVSRSMWNVYDSIFTFLLQVKWAKYSLDELRFSDLEGGDVAISRREIHVTRMKLLHFVNNFHDWMMTTVLCGTKENTPWNEASNLQVAMDEHDRHLRLLQERCLLSPNTKVVHDSICNVLNAAVVFHDLWKGIDSKRIFNGSTLPGDFEKELSSCRLFLFGLLRNTSWTSSQTILLHVESLVTALGGSSFDVTNSDSSSYS